MSGTVNVIRGAGGKPTPARPGEIFPAGTTFDTGADGRAVIKFQDGQLAAMQPNSTFRIDQYSYDQKNVRNSNAAFSFLKGALRMVSGVIASTVPSRVRLAAGTATIGIRGTDITVAMENGNLIAASVISGALSV